MSKVLDEVSEKIKDIISTHIRPAVAQDGGDIVFENFKDGNCRMLYSKSKSNFPVSEKR